MEQPYEVIVDALKFIACNAICLEYIKTSKSYPYEGIKYHGAFCP